MGYYINIDEANLILPQKNQTEILARWKDLNKSSNNHLKTGGSWSEGKKTQSWYSWMDADYDKKATSASEVLRMLHFDYSTLSNGDISVESYDCKSGQEDLFFKTISDLIPAGSYIHWRGEDGATFSWVFDGKKMLEIDTQEAIKFARNLAVQMATQKTIELPISIPVEKKETEPTIKKKGRYVL